MVKEHMILCISQSLVYVIRDVVDSKNGGGKDGFHIIYPTEALNKGVEKGIIKITRGAKQGYT